MTLKEFCNAKDKVFISCQTQEEAILLNKKLNKLGILWASGEPHSLNLINYTYGANTIYGPHTMGNLKDYKFYCDKIVDFNSIDDFYDDFNEKYISIDTFFKSKKCLGIQINTVEEGEKLFKRFDEFGKEWNNGEKYTSPQHTIRVNECFFNDGTWSSNSPTKTELKQYNIKQIFNFSDVVDFWFRINPRLMKGAK